jgi:hypothetical protein
VLLLATAVDGGIDSTTALTLGATMVPYIAMVAIIRHLDVRLPTVRDLATAACVGGAVVVALTIAKSVVAGRLSERLGAFAFGPAPEAGVVLAPLLLLVPAMRASRWIKLGAAVCLGAGLVLTQARGALIATFAGALVLIATQKSRRLRLAEVTAVGIAAAAALIFSSRTYSFTDRATTYRRANLELHWHLFLDRPLLGHGIAFESISAVRAAHNTLLSIADAGGAILLLLWIAALIVLPLVAGLDREKRLSTAPVGVAAIVAVFIGWNTTGSEVLMYDPPTNLLPLMLAGALVARPQPLGRLRGGRAAIPAGVAVVAAMVLALLSATGVVSGGASARAMSDGQRARVLVAAQQMAFSSCGDCGISSIREVAPGLAEARFTRRTPAMPSECIFIAPGAYQPTPLGFLPPGVSWGQCAAAGTSDDRSTEAWLSPPTVTPSMRVRARASVRRWLGTRCATSCTIASLDALTPFVWRVRSSGSLAPSRCFVLFLDGSRSLGTGYDVLGRASVSCAGR